MTLSNIISFAEDNQLFELSTKLRELEVSSAAIRFDDAGYLMSNPDVRQGGFEAYAHWVKHGCREGRLGSGLSPYANRKLPVPRSNSGMRIAYYGPISAQNGLGTAARGYVTALMQLGLQLDVIDTTAAIFPHMQFPDIELPGEKPDVVIIHQNADALHNFFKKVPLSILDDAYVIGIWVWEMAAFDPHWVEHFAAVDEIWTPSEFSTESIRCLAPLGMPIVTVPHVIDLPQKTAKFDRSHFGLPNDVFIFLYVFDASSGIDRKNPEGLISAFAEVFGDRQDVMLLMKCHSTGHASDRLRDIRKAGDRGNVVVLDSLLDDDENHSLKFLSDAFVSPHRAEGFGLNIAEMMALGKPVIVTGYSGNLGFCETDGTFLVDFELVEHVNDGDPYKTGYVWAEPQQESLKRQLNKVASKSASVAKISRAGQIKVKRDLSSTSVGKLMSSRLNDIKTRADSYQSVLHQHEIKTRYVWRNPVAQTSELATCLNRHEEWPVISVVVPVYNVPAKLLEACIDSVLRQDYPYWELCICDDASSDLGTLDYLHSLRGTDSRIKIRTLSRNRGISGCTNAAVEIATGSYVAFLDNDDVISSDALSSYAEAIVDHPDVTLFYCDEDKISASGEFVDHYLKPDWSPEHLESAMYVLHMLVIKKSRFLKMGGYREKFTGAQDYDLLLRLSLSGDKIFHIPKILYHWRMVEGSAAADVSAKPTALVNAKAALDEYAKSRFGQAASAEDGKLHGLFRVTRGRGVAPPVTLVMTTNNGSKDVADRGHINLCGNFINSILKRTNYPNFEIVVVSNGSLDDDVRSLLRDNNHREVPYSYVGDFNFSKKANFAFAQANTEIVVLLNDDMEIISEDWLWHLVDYIARAEIGVVGSKLLYPNGRIQHAGVVLGVNETAAHLYHGHPGETVGYNGYPMTTRNFSAVTGACMATKKSVVREVGGFDEAFKIDFNDTDFCLRVRSSGYRVVYNPLCELYHFESQTAVRHQQDPLEKSLFLNRWQSLIKSDPYYNKNLRTDSIIFEAKKSAWLSGRFERGAAA